MIALSKKAAQLLDLLRANGEGACEHGADGHEWRDVYLDNARPHDMSPRQFAWHLSSLSKAGLYRPIDGFAFGRIRMDDDRAITGIDLANEDRREGI